MEIVLFFICTVCIVWEELGRSSGFFLILMEIIASFISLSRFCRSSLLSLVLVYCTTTRILVFYLQKHWKFTHILCFHLLFTLLTALSIFALQYPSWYSDTPVKTINQRDYDKQKERIFCKDRTRNWPVDHSWHKDHSERHWIYNHLSLYWTYWFIEAECKVGK